MSAVALVVFIALAGLFWMGEMCLVGVAPPLPCEGSLPAQEHHNQG